jgi:hypothetical protein
MLRCNNLNSEASDLGKMPAYWLAPGFCDIKINMHEDGLMES